MDLYLCENITRREDAYALLAYAARRRWGLEQLPAIARGKQGKPYFPAHPQYHFNLSHSGNLALCALDEHPVGADIELVRPHHPKLAQRICCAEELDWLEEQDDPVSALCQLWTRKEALVKYNGTGLTVPLREIAVPLIEENAVLDDLHFHTLCGNGWVGTVCGHTTPPLVIVPRQEIFG